MTAVQDAPAKLTLTLRIAGRRADGYHLIEAEMVTVDLADRLEFEPVDGLDILDERRGAGEPLSAGEDNLVVRALRAVGRRAHVRLTKRIPLGAGLGGGSADAAAVLRWAGCRDLTVAAGLGADVPFCLAGGRAVVRGIGEVVTPLAPRRQVFTLVTPPVPVATPAVYRAWDALGGPTGEGPNDLEPAALAVAPQLARWRDELGDATGHTPVLAGSGGTWFVEGSFPEAGLVVTTTGVDRGHALDGGQGLGGPD